MEASRNDGMERKRGKVFLEQRTSNRDDICSKKKLPTSSIITTVPLENDLPHCAR